MMKKFDEILDAAVEANKAQKLSDDALGIVVTLIPQDGDDYDASWDASSFADALCDVDVLKEHEGEWTQASVEEAYDFFEGYKMPPEFHPDYNHACATGMSMGEAYAQEYNDLADYTTDDHEFVELVKELDDQADADISEKPANDWLVFDDGSMVNFATNGDRYARAVDEPAPVDETGNQVNWEAVVALMDDDIREKLHAELAPCSKQKFFEAYAKAHKARFNEDFAPWVGGEW